MANWRETGYIPREDKGPPRPEDEKPKKASPKEKAKDTEKK